MGRLSVGRPFSTRRDTRRARIPAARSSTGIEPKGQAGPLLVHRESVLIRETLHRGYRYALSLTHDEAEAEDILHDAWLSVLAAGRQTEFRYLVATIRNRFIDLHRREQVVVMVAIPDDAADSLADPRPLDDEILLDRITLERALAQLRPVEREALYLQYVERYTQQEIATLLDCPIGTVGSLVVRATRKLKALCRADEEESSR